MRFAIASMCATGFAGGHPLPVPRWMAIYGAAVAVLLSFAVVVTLRPIRRQPRPAGLLLPAASSRVLDAHATRAALRALGLALLTATLIIAVLGPDDPATNPAPTWIYVWFWVGLAPLSAVLGPVWRLVNPLRTLAALMRHLVRFRRPLPDGLGYWPAAGGLLVFTWVELVYGRATAPVTVATFVCAYAVVHTLLGAVFGSEWFDRADTFEAYSTLLGHLSPLGRKDGRLVLRDPLTSLAFTGPDSVLAPGLVAFVAALLGSTAFDGLTRMPWWNRFLLAHGGGSRSGELLVGALGLVTCVAFVLITYHSAIRSVSSNTHQNLEGRFVVSLLPISLGYTVAHYFSYLIFQGQAGYLLAGDPFGRGWDLFGLARHQIDYSLVGPESLAVIQVAAIVVGHALGAVIAHDRASTAIPHSRRLSAETPLIAMMIAYTIGGVALVANA